MNLTLPRRLARSIGLLLLTTLGLTWNAAGQTPTPAPQPEQVLDQVYTQVEQMPELPGGGGNKAVIGAPHRATRVRAHPSSAGVARE